MNEFEMYIKKVGDYHGHVCFGIAMGTKITLAAMHYLGLDPTVKNKNLIVYAEIDRCMTDAVQVISGCTLGHRTLKHVDYGKFAATFVNLTTGKAVRATIFESCEIKGSPQDVVEKMAALPDSEVVKLQEVKMSIAEVDLPGLPKKRESCSVCGERIMDGRAVIINQKTLCRACANGKYYSEIAKEGTLS
ncbi:MAG: FmdE family protein [Candidatus Bathyarchaeia archaeon]|jgi:formylmethanofuran dehydrogenase subunit E